MTFKDKLEIAVYVATLLGVGWGCLSGGSRLVRWWKLRREEQAEEQFLVAFRTRSRADSHGMLMVDAEPGSPDYFFYERMARKGKLQRTSSGYGLPEDAPDSW